MPAALNTAAQRIAEAVAEERSVTTPILRGVVKTEAEKSTKKLQRQIQSLQAQLDNTKSNSKPFKKNNLKNPTTQNQGQGFQGRNGKAEKKGRAINQSRTGPDDRSNATTSPNKKNGRPICQ